MSASRRSRVDRGVAGGQRGFALVLAMLLLVILTILGIGLMFNVSVEQTLASTSTKVSKVFYAADSGIEYAGSSLSSSVGFDGGPMPIGISSHYPPLPAPDIQVTVSRPVMVAYEIRPGDQLGSSGAAYGSSQIVEAVYAVRSTAASSAIQASKGIDAQIGVYPKQLSTPQ